MKPWPYEQIRRVTLSRWLGRGTREPGGGVCTDSRRINPGDLFIAIKGPNFDAHEFLPQVIAAGASGILIDQPATAEVLAMAARESASVLQTDNTIRGLNRLAAAYRKDVRAKIIAVGGANGKTSTKQMIHALLQGRFSGVASPKSFNNNIGLPLTVLTIEPQHDYAVLEVGTNAPGEVAALARIAAPDIAVITGIGLEHLEFLQNLACVAKEEASLARSVPPTGMLMLTNHSPELLDALRFFKHPRLTVGTAESAADYAASEIRESWRGCRFVINGRQQVEIPLLGRHNVFNAMLAMAVARRMGLTDEEIACGLEKLKPAPMRLEIQTCAGHRVINDAYNANPTSMAAAIETFGNLPAPDGGGPCRRVAVLGDMLELGPQGPDLHVEIGRLAAARGLDFLAAAGPLMQFAVDAFKAEGRSAHHFPDTAAAAAALPELLRTGDLILLKGSRSMRMERILEKMTETATAGPLRCSAART